MSERCLLNEIGNRSFFAKSNIIFQVQRFCQLKFYYRIIFFSLDIKAIRKQHLMPFERKKSIVRGVFSFFFLLQSAV